ncbi:hypothetical protein HK103_005565 [Boothiomyces macroporosus]|uniref:Uncharacterized protein n=1 Tax=Boothiomyces macroporosus TaxID=261099 RepID=A0AAD5UJA5_9FUNG|nr:hypothetical protein HK103_005565 [Boothiomyces macroporosus]
MMSFQTQSNVAATTVLAFTTKPKANSIGGDHSTSDKSDGSTSSSPRDNLTQIQEDSSATLVPYAGKKPRAWGELRPVFNLKKKKVPAPKQHGVPEPNQSELPIPTEEDCVWIIQSLDTMNHQMYPYLYRSLIKDNYPKEYRLRVLERMFELLL